MTLETLIQKLLLIKAEHYSNIPVYIHDPRFEDNRVEAFSEIDKVQYSTRDAISDPAVYIFVGKGFDY